MIETVFEPGLLGRRCWLELATGERISLATARWRAAPDPGDELLLSSCVGPTLDIGCGPGRLTAALAERGVLALGTDISAVAVRLTVAAGGLAVRRDVFAPQPGEGHWRHALLADGNIGIGGDPVRLLRRVRELLCATGSALVEVDPPGVGLRHGRVRLSTDEAEPPTTGLPTAEAEPSGDGLRPPTHEAEFRHERARPSNDGPGQQLTDVAPPQGDCVARSENESAEEARWFDWAWLGVDAVPETAAQAGLSVRWTRAAGGRWFTELTRS